MSENSTKSPSTFVKVLLVALSVFLCLCLFASILATALIADARLLTSKSSFEKVISQILTKSARPMPLTAAAGGLSIPGIDGSDALVSWVYDALKEQYGDELTITEDQMSEFLEESTFKEFVAEKSADYLEDVFTGNMDTTITAEELKQLIEENSGLIEDTFGVVMSPEISDSITNMVEDININEMIRDQVLGNFDGLDIPGITSSAPTTDTATSTDEEAAVDDDLLQSVLDGSFSLVKLLPLIRALTSTTTLVIFIVIDLLLVVALFFTNRMRIAGTLTCVGIPTAVAGLLLTVAVIALRLVSSTDSMLSILGVVASVIAPVHYSLLGIGAVAIALAVVIKSFQRKNTDA